MSIRFPASSAIRRSLIDQLPVEHRSPEGCAFRRRVVVIVTAGCGAAALAWGLRTDPGSGEFYLSTFALAAIWVVGGLLAGPVHLGWTLHNGRVRRPVLEPIIAGAALAAVFVAGALVVRHIAVLADRVDGILAYARDGSWSVVLTLTVANGLAEEVFFRGAVQPALPERMRLPGTVLIYAVITMATGNIMLGAAAVILGALVGLQRRSSDGILAPVLTHVTWSVAMLVTLPLVFR